MCPPEDGAVDKRPKSGYSIDKEGAASRSAPPRTRLRDNRYFGRGRLSLLVIVGLENQGNDSSNDHAELKNSFPCNHAITPSLSIGGKRRLLPPKKVGGTACRGAGSTIHSLSQNATNCKQNTHKYGKKPIQQRKSVLYGLFCIYFSSWKPMMTTPSTTSTTPVA